MCKKFTFTLLLLIALSIGNSFSQYTINPASIVTWYDTSGGNVVSHGVPEAMCQNNDPQVIPLTPTYNGLDITHVNGKWYYLITENWLDDSDPLNPVLKISNVDEAKYMSTNPPVPLAIVYCIPHPILPGKYNAYRQYARIYPAPKIYNLDPDPISACYGDPLSIKLSNTDGQTRYSVFADGIEVYNAGYVGSNADYVFNIYDLNPDVNREYTVRAYNDFLGISISPCQQLMNGSVSGITYSLPVISLSSDMPVSLCRNQSALYYTTLGMNGYVWDYDSDYAELDESGGPGTAGGSSSDNFIKLKWKTATPFSATTKVRVNYEDASTSCVGANFAELEITVNELPIPNFVLPSDATVCINSVGRYTVDAGMDDYTWSISGGGTIITPNPETSNSIEVQWTTSGSYKVKVGFTDPLGCTSENEKEFDVVVNPRPNHSIGGDNSVCVNSQGVYTVNSDPGLSNYQWNVSAGGTINGVNNQASLLVDWTTVGEHTISLKYEDANNCEPTVPATYTVTVKDRPTPDFTVNSVCVGEAVTYTANLLTALDYKWVITDGGVVTATGNSSAITYTWTTTDPTNSVSLNYTVNECDAVNPTTHNISVKSRPDPKFLESTAAVCQGATDIRYRTEAGMTNYTWSIIPAIPFTIGGSGEYIDVDWNVTPGNYTIRVNYEVNDCDAINPTEMTVTVRSLPNYVITGPSPVCANSLPISGAYSLSGASNISSYSWSILSGDATINGLSDQSTLSVNSGLNDFSLSLHYVDIYGCAPAADPTFNVDVTPLPTPALSPSTPAMDVCVNESVTYTADNLSAIGYTWTVTNGTAQTPLTGSSITVLWDTPGVTGTITLNYTVNGCDALNPTEYNIAVKNRPNPLLINPVLSMCEGSTNIIYTTQAGMSNYSWIIPAGVTKVSGGGLNDNTVTLSFPTHGSYSISVNYEEDGCSASVPSVYTIDVNWIDATISSSVSNIICQADEVTFQASVNNGGTAPFLYSFYRIRGGVPSLVQAASANNLYTTNDLLDGDILYATISDANLCSDNSAQIVMVVNPLPSASVDPIDPVCENSNVTISAKPTGMAKYVFHVISGGVTTDYNQNAVNTLVYTPIDNDKISVTVTSSAGCVSTSTEQTVSVTSTPVVAPLTYTSPTGSTTVCESSTVSFDALSGADVYTIELVSVGLTPEQTITLRDKGNNDAFTVTATDHFTNATGFTVRVTGYNGALECQSTPVTATFSINKPTVQFVNPVTTICEGADASFTVTGVNANEYIFFVNNILGVPVQGWSTSNTVTISGLQNNDVVYVQSRSAAPYTCPSEFAQVTITTVALPNPSVDPIAPICEGTPVIVQANPAGMSNYVFHVDRGGVVTNYDRGSNSTYPTSDLQNNDVVSVTVTAATGCSATSVGQTVVVTAIPVVAPLTYTTPSGTTTVCESSSVSFDPLSGADVYTIELVSVGLTPEQTITLRDKGNNDAFTVTATDHFTNATGFTVRVTGYNGALECQSTPVTATFSINKPTVQFDNPVTTICEGADASFTVTGVDANEYIFFVNNVLGVPVQGWSTSNTVTISGLQNNDVVYVQSRSAAPYTCPSEFAQVTITTVALPNPSVDPIAPFCEGTPVIVQANPAGMSNYVFHVDRGGVVTNYDRGSNSTYPTSDLQNNDVVSVTVTAATGCSATSVGQTVVVTAIPVVAPLTYTTPSGTTTVCESSSVSFDPLSGADVYTIELVSVGLTPEQTITLRDKGNNDAFTVTATDHFTNATGFTVRVTGYNGALECQSTVVSETFNIEKPTASFVAPANSVCDGSNLILTATGTDAVEYRFFVDNTTTPVQDWSAQNMFDYTYTSANNGQVVYVQSRSVQGCTSDIVAGPTMNVHPIPAKAVIDASVLSVCANSTVTFDVTTPVLANASYSFVIDGDMANPVVTTDPQYVISNRTTDYTIAAYVTSEFGCQSPLSDVVNIDVIEPFTLTLDITNGVTSPLCEGVVVEFSATGADTYQFAVDGVFVTALPQATSTFQYTTSALVPNPIISVIGFKSGLTDCPGVATPIQLQVIKPTASFVAPANSVCDGSNLILTATGTDAVEYRFFVDNTTTPVQDWSAQNTFDYTYTSANNGQVVYVQSRSVQGCTSDIVAGPTINVHPIPAKAVIDASVLSVCANGTVTFDVTTPVLANASYSFVIDGDMANPVVTTDPQYVISNRTTDYTIAAYVTSEFGCQSPLSDVVNIDVIEPFTLTLDITNGVTSPLCEGVVVEFSATGADTYQFAVDGVFVTALPQATSTFQYTTSALVPNPIISVIGFKSGLTDCPGVATPIQLQVIKPTASFVAPANSVCDGSNLILTATGTDAVEYRFFVDNTTTPVQDWSAQNTFDYTYTSANNGQVVYVQSRSVQGCTSDIVTGPTMTVNPLPTSTLSLSATSSNPVCANEAVTFEAATDFGDTFQFLMNGVPVAGTTGNSFTINSSDIVNPVTVLVTNSATGCAMLSNEINMTVNPLPLAGISASPGIEVINGMTVTFTGTGGVEYQFDVNSTPGIDQAFSTDDTFDSSTLIAGDIVTVTVRDANGCENTASLTMSVLAEIESKIVTANPNAYCIGENGVSIYVKDPQPMVTYELIRVDDGMELGVGVLDGTRVLWTNVKNTTVGDNTYRVVGYYLSVPSAPKVNIGETVIKLYDNPIQFNMSPNEVKTDCNNGAGYEITLDGSESGVIYELYIDNSPSGVERTSDDADVNGIISFGSTEFGGSYTIYGRWENLNTCGMFMNGELRIDVPGTAYYVVSDRTDGLYCQGDVGVAISLSDSDLGVEYFLTMNGSIVGSSIIGTGGVLSFGHHDAEGTYKIYAQFPGCPKWMNGAVTVKQIQTPKVFTLSATNAGHFCKGSNGVTVSVAGQQLDYIYTLYRNGISTGQTFIGIVDDDNAVFTFTDKVVDAGSYTVVAQDPIVGCSSETDEYIISMDLLPVPVLLPTEPLDFCEGSYASFTFVPENGVEYELLDENGLVVIPASASGVFSYDQPGTYRVHAINTTTLCDIIYATDIVINPVRPLPDKTLNVDFVQGIGCDDGALITITNPQVDITYVIVDANNTDLQLGDEWVVTAPNYDSDLDGTPDQVQFNPVFDKNADYRIKAISEYGCESILDDGPIHVDVPGTVKKQQVVLPETMCMGDGGVKITLENSEPGVTYTLYFIENGNRIFKQDAVSIGGILEFKEPVYSEGIWSIEGVDKNATIQCPNLMIPSEFEIRFNPLPISYKLDANSGIYCDPAEAKIVLENSEYGIEYYLMRKMANGLYDFVEKQMGNNLSGGIQSLSFTPKKDDDGAVIDGTYMVYAKNPETGCTSNMENIVEVEQRNAPGAFSIQSVDECSADGMLTVEMTGFEAGVTYTVTNDANPPVVVFEGEVANSAFTKLPTGNYSAVASWNGQCASDPVTFAVNAPVSPATPVATISSNSICGSSEVVSITEPAPISDLYYGVERSDDGAATWTINKPMQLSDGTPIEWNDINDGTITNSTFRVVVSNYAGGECGVPSKEMSLSVLPQPIAAPVKVEETTNCTADGKVAILIQGNEAGVIYTVTDNKNADAVVYSGLITSSADADDWYVLTRVETGNYKISANWATNMSCGIDLNTALPVEAPSQPTAPAITINGNSFAHEVCGDAGTVLIQFKEGSYDPTLYYSLSRKESNGTITTTLPAINDGSGWDVSVGASTGDIYWVNAFTDASNTSCVSNNSNTVLFTQGIAPSGTTIWAQDLGYCIGEKGVQIGVLNPDLNEVVYRLVRVISEVDGVITFEHVEYLMTNSSDFTKYQYTLDNDPNYPSTAYLPFKNYVQAGVYAVFASYPYGDCSSFVEMNNRLLVFEKDVSDCSKLTAIDDFMFLNGEDVSRSINVFYDAETATDLDIRNPDIDFYNTEVEAPNLEFVLLDAACYEDQECKASRKDKRGNDDPFFGSVSLNKKTGEFIYTKVFGFYGTETIEYIVRNLDFPDSRVDTATITIMVGNKDFHDKGTLLIPNAFSPNDDDYNDTFIITGNVDFDEENNDKPINISDNNVFSSLEVYNRWGSLVYKSKGGRYGDEKAWWDGKGNAGAMVSIGSDLPNGTYFYIFKVSYNKTNGTPKTQHYNGFVELKR